MKVKVVVKQQGTQGFAICEPECHIPNTQNGHGFLWILGMLASGPKNLCRQILSWKSSWFDVPLQFCGKILNISQFKQRHMVLEIRVKLPETARYECSEWTIGSGPVTVYSAFWWRGGRSWSSISIRSLHGKQIQTAFWRFAFEIYIIL